MINSFKNHESCFPYQFISIIIKLSMNPTLVTPSVIQRMMKNDNYHMIPLVAIRDISSSAPPCSATLGLDSHCDMKCSTAGQDSNDDRLVSLVGINFLSLSSGQHFPLPHLLIVLTSACNFFVQIQNPYCNRIRGSQYPNGASPAHLVH